MKQIIILCALLIVSCSSSKQEDWDSGATRQQNYQQERMEEQTEDVRNQNPEPVNHVRSQPF